MYLSLIILCKITFVVLGSAVLCKLPISFVTECLNKAISGRFFSSWMYVS